MHPASVFYANVDLGAHKTAHFAWHGLPVITRPYEFYRDLAAATGLHVEVLGPLRDFGHHTGINSQDSQAMLRVVNAPPQQGVKSPFLRRSFDLTRACTAAHVARLPYSTH